MAWPIASTVFGYGFNAGRNYDRRWIGHGGGVHGFLTDLARYPDEKLFVVALCNLTSSNPKEVTDTLAAIVFGEEYTVPEVREAIELNPELYRTYEGEYQLALGINITITAGEHFIIATGTGGGTANFFPESETQFFRKSTDDKITFVNIEKENVRYLLLTQQGMEVRANIVE